MENKTLHFAIDIETTSTVAGAGIWQIGACAWTEYDVAQGVRGIQNYPQSICVSCQPDGIKDDATLAWIASKPKVLKQYELACKSNVTQIMGIDLLMRYVIDTRLNCFGIGAIADRDRETVYSWGTFDFPLLSWQFGHWHYPLPWHYGSECDVRSHFKYTGEAKRPSGITHNALDDALALRELIANDRGLTNGGGS